MNMQFAASLEHMQTCSRGLVANNDDAEACNVCVMVIFRESLLTEEREHMPPLAKGVCYLWKCALFILSTIPPRRRHNHFNPFVFLFVFRWQSKERLLLLTLRRFFTFLLHFFIFIYIHICICTQNTHMDTGMTLASVRQSSNYDLTLN